MAAGSNIRWYRVKEFVPVPLLPEEDLSTRVLMNRVMELWADAGWGSNNKFIRIYGIIALMTVIVGVPQMLSVLQGRSALCVCDNLQRPEIFKSKSENWIIILY